MIKRQLIKTTTLSKQELRNVTNLVEYSEKKDGYMIRMYWNIINDRQLPEFDDFFYYVEGRLAGYLALYAFKAHQAEMSAVVHPEFRRQGIFRYLFGEAMMEMNRREITDCLYVSHRDSVTSKDFVTPYSDDLDHTEVEMALKHKPKTTDTPKLTMRLVDADDLDILARIDMACFNSKPEKIYNNFAKNLGSKVRRAWIFKNEQGEDIGKMHIRLENPQAAYIHDLGVLPDHRRKGYASSMVLLILEQLRKEGCHRVFLDVLSDNESAIKLYENCGFEITSQYDLWRLKTADTLGKIIKP